MDRLGTVHDLSQVAGPRSAMPGASTVECAVVGRRGLQHETGLLNFDGSFEVRTGRATARAMLEGPVSIRSARPELGPTPSGRALDVTRRGPGETRFCTVANLG